MRLSKLFKNAPTVNITGLCSDSRKVKPGNIYFCLPGITHDGHDFINQAIARGDGIDSKLLTFMMAQEFFHA